MARQSSYLTVSSRLLLVPVRRVARALLLGLLCAPLAGCLVTTVVGVAAETVEAGVGITGAAVGATAGAVVDAVDGDDEDREKREPEEESE